MHKKIKIVTLGCYKNLVDSERLMRQLELNGIELIPEENKSENIDIVAINTCGFIHDAKEESINTILEYINQKRQKKVSQIFVFGCLSERYKNELLQEIPEVDRYFGKFALDDIVKATQHNTLTSKIYQRTITTPKHYAYLKISEGCNRKCAFCAIPLITGKHQSIEIEQLVKETQYIAQHGAKEIILVAQDLNQFGSDLRPKSSLYEVIEKISEISDIEWIRLQYLYPQGFPEKLPKIIANNPKICHYIDIPFQHFHNKVLELMNRKHTCEDNLKIIDMLRNAVPDIAIRTTLIVGYPGETAKRFEELVKFVEQVKFDRLGAFTYSHEENTPAAKTLKDNISQKIKEQRLAHIMSVQEQISYEKNTKKIGTVQKVLIDKQEGDFFIGRTQYDSPEIDNEVLIDAKINNTLKIGEFYNMKITDSQTFDLFATIQS